MTIVDYEGPLGRGAEQLARRRIAVAADAKGRPYLIRADSIVIELDDEHPLDLAHEQVRGHGLDVLGPPPDAPPSGLVGARLDAQRRRPIPVERWSTADVTDLVEELTAAGCRARPNHVYLADGVGRQLGIVSPGGAGPAPAATPPELVGLRSTARAAAAPYLRPRLQLADRRRPNVLVLDTGLATRGGEPAHDVLRDHCVVHEPWLDATVGRFNDEDEPDDDGGGRLDRQAGHGTFVSGVIRQVCPDAVVHHAGVLSSYGDGDDASIAHGLDRALRRLQAHGATVDVVVMAFGSYSASDVPPPVSAAIDRLIPHAVVVASAGNDATSRPCFPAALPGVVGVGSVDGQQRSAFSNFGAWVDAAAPGAGVVSTFFTDFAEHDDRGAALGTYAGWASWSGTSFAAPKVAGAIAQSMYLRGGTAPEAWELMRTEATFRHPDLGVLVNV